jgi:hypothetical protein
MSSKHSERDARMCDLYRAGRTLVQLGDQFGISDERARQIVRAAGLRRQDGGGVKRIDSQISAAQPQEPEA